MHVLAVLFIVQHAEQQFLSKDTERSKPTLEEKKSSFASRVCCTFFLRAIVSEGCGAALSCELQVTFAFYSIWSIKSLDSTGQLKKPSI